jgi:hypothetical protein
VGLVPGSILTRWELVMRRFSWFVAAVSVAAVACHASRPQQPAPSGAAPSGTPASAAPAAATVPATAAAGAPGTPGAGGPPRRPRPTPWQQDSMRRTALESVLKEIAGRESQPAGVVFKNVQVLKNMPAGEFVRGMNDSYGRGIGFTCNQCHVAGNFASDERKNKVIARDMQRIVDHINTQQLPQIKQLDAEYEKVSCVTCHNGTNHVVAKAAVPVAPK